MNVMNHKLFIQSYSKSYQFVLYIVKKFGITPILNTITMFTFGGISQRYKMVILCEDGLTKSTMRNLPP